MGPESEKLLQRLVERLSQGDRSAFHPVFEMLWPMLRDFSMRALRDPADAEDAAQQALMKIFRAASRFQEGRPALPWIFAIAANECRALARRRRRRREDPLQDQAAARPAGDPTPEDAALTRSLGEAARTTLATLGPRDAEAILAAIGEGNRPETSPATFRKRLSRAVTRLRAAWKESHDAA